MCFKKTVIVFLYFSYVLNLSCLDNKKPIRHKGTNYSKKTKILNNCKKSQSLSLANIEKPTPIKDASTLKLKVNEPRKILSGEDDNQTTTFLPQIKCLKAMPPNDFKTQKKEAYISDNSPTFVKVDICGDKQDECIEQIGACNSSEDSDATIDYIYSPTSILGENITLKFSACVEEARKDSNGEHCGEKIEYRYKVNTCKKTNNSECQENNMITYLSYHISKSVEEIITHSKELVSCLESKKNKTVSKKEEVINFLAQSLTQRTLFTQAIFQDPNTIDYFKRVIEEQNKNIDGGIADHLTAAAVAFKYFKSNLGHELKNGIKLSEDPCDNKNDYGNSSGLQLAGGHLSRAALAPPMSYESFNAALNKTNYTELRSSLDKISIPTDAQIWMKESTGKISYRNQGDINWTKTDIKVTKSMKENIKSKGFGPRSPGKFNDAPDSFGKFEVGDSSSYKRFGENEMPSNREKFKNEEGVSFKKVAGVAGIAVVAGIIYSSTQGSSSLAGEENESSTCFNNIIKSSKEIFESIKSYHCQKKCWQKRLLKNSKKEDKNCDDICVN